MIPPTPTTAIFDFDGTILHGDSLFAFARMFLSPWRFFSGIARAIPAILAWKLGFSSSSKAKMKLFGAWYKGLPLDTFDRWGNRFADYIDSHTNHDVLSALQAHLKAGDRVYIISASLTNWISPWAKRQGNIRVLATEAQTDSNHRLTGNFEGRNCLGQEKVKRLKADPNFNPNVPIAVYTDSLSDLPIIKISSTYNIVTKDGSMQKGSPSPSKPLNNQ
jgi:HAD superfamily hydrolase (TIGR01490 family)